MKWMRISGTAAVLAALAAGLALALGLLGSWTASAQDTFIVNSDTGAGDPAPCGSPDFPSVSDIETVIDDASVQNDDTLVLCPGTYNAGAGGPVEVDKKITIEGLAAANRQDVVVQASSNGFEINVSSVILRHLKLDGPTAANNGITVNTGTTVIEDVDVTDWGVGILVTWTGNVTIRDSYIHNNEPDGIMLDHADDIRVAHNDITGNSRNGIRADTADQIVVEDNAIAGGPPNQYEMHVGGRGYVQILRNTFATHVAGTQSTGGIELDLPAEALVTVGGSDANANTFDGDMASDMYYIRLTCASEATVDATHNYWKGDAAVSRGVSGVILNDEDDPSPGVDCPPPDDVKGAVVFHPTASGPAPTPTPSPTPTATSTPTPTATATPTATPGATRSIDLSPQGWHDFVWTGPDNTEPATALACISGKYGIAYRFIASTQSYQRYVEGCSVPGICNMSALNKYDSLLVLITAAGATCQMPVAP